MSKLFWIRTRSPRPAARRKGSARLLLEPLEDRCVPATFPVTTANDAGAGSLRQAILDANATAGADTIVFDPAINGQVIVLATALPAVTDALTIAGPGSNGITISGNNAVRIFQVNAGVTVTLSGLTLSNGSTGAIADEEGGAILNNGNLTLTNDTFTSNTALAGGAVANVGATAHLTVNTSTFTQNSAGNFGGAIFNVVPGAQLTITSGSTFSSNRCDEGGAIFNQTGTSATINGASFTGNSGGPGDGAGILNNGTMTVTNTTLAGNSGRSNGFTGGAIFNGGSLSLLACAVYGNLSEGAGGGIWSRGTVCNITNTTIANNVALANGGGGGILVLTGGNLALLNDTITGNVDASGLATSAGGVDFFGTVFTINNTIVAQNEAPGAGNAPDIRGTVASGVNNFIGDATGLVGLTNGSNGNQIGAAGTPIDPKLGPLTDNGGPTFSRKPLLGSPVINAGNNPAAAALATDQRGFLRLVGPSVDIGAVEFQTPAVVVTLSVSPSAATPFHRAVTLTAQVTPDPTPNDPVTGTVTFFVNGTTALGTATLDATGTATFTTTSAVPLPVGTDTITAVYNGDFNYRSGISPGVTHTVVRPVPTPAVFDPATATWYIRNSFSGGPPSITAFQFGSPGDEPIMGDWTGSGTWGIGVFTPATATFHLRNSASPGAADFTFVFGPTAADLGGNNAVAVAGDWDGDGIYTIGVFAPTRGDWDLRNENNGGIPDAGSFLFGALGSKPVVGDWANTGQFGVGVVEPSGVWKLKTILATGTPDFTFAFGAPGDQVVAGDWDGNGTWTPGVLEDNGSGALVWKLRNSNSGGPPDIAPFVYGASTFTGLVGDPDFPVMPQFAAGGEGPGAASISTADLGGIVQAALARLGQEGFDPATRARLAQVTALIRPLAPGQLGGAVPQANTILLSPDGAGHGWFVDSTPLQDEEFAAGAAYPGSPAAGREDLLTTVMHELGHLAGLPDDNSSGLMGEFLPVGTRRLEGRTPPA
jgi:hypothetical protein